MAWWNRQFDEVSSDNCDHDQRPTEHTNSKGEVVHEVHCINCGMVWPWDRI